MFHIEKSSDMSNESLAVPLRKYAFIEGDPIFAAKSSSSATKVRDAIFRAHVAGILIDLRFALDDHSRPEQEARLRSDAERSMVGRPPGLTKDEMTCKLFLIGCANSAARSFR
jgi:hypothetical protein